MMATNYFGLQQGPEFNLNGDAYNGFMGAQSGPSIMNSGSQPSTTKSGSSSPFDSFLTHANAMYDFMNGGNYGQPSTTQRQPSGTPWMGDPGYNIGSSGGGFTGPSRPGVVGSTQPVSSGWTSGGGFPIAQEPPYAPNDPSQWNLTGGAFPVSGPTRPGVVGSIQPVGGNSTLTGGAFPINGTRTPTGIGGNSGLTGAAPGAGGTYYDQSHFTTAAGQPDALAYYRQWLPNLTLDQLGQYWGGAGNGQRLDQWYGSTFNPDGTPKQQTPFTPITGGSDTARPTAGGGTATPEPVNNGTYRPDFFGLRAPGSQTPTGAPTGGSGLTNLAGQPTPVPVGTPGATGTPGAPGSGGTVADMIHQLLSPLQQQQQGDLLKSLNQNAAVTGDINAGGYSQGTGPSSVNRQLSDLMAQQGSQEAGYLQQANESALERQLRHALGNMGLEGTKYSADAGLQGAMAGANATEGAASIAANSALQRAGLDYQLGLGNLDVSRENNLMNFMSNMFGMSPQMLQTLLASSPEGLLSGQTVPTGNIIVKP